MDVDDWKLLAAGFAIQVAPFLLFTLWTAVRLPDRRVVEWFAAFGRLHRSGIPLVRERLVRIRWHRRSGALLGATAMWAATGWYGIVEVTNGPAELVWLPVLGYAAGAVVGEVRAVRAPQGPARSADLTPRALSDYLAPWVLPAVGAVVTTSLVGTVAAAVTRVDPSTTELVARVATTVGASVVALWAARRVLRLPMSSRPDVDPYLDDAFRQTSAVTCLAAACLGSLATSDVGAALFELVGGWWSLAWMAALWPVALGSYFAMKQPVPWTFGPRIRRAWTAAPGAARADGAPAAAPEQA